MKGVVDLWAHWVPGHKNFALNKEADRHVKRAAEGDSSPSNKLPKSLRKPLPLRIQCYNKS